MANNYFQSLFLLFIIVTFSSCEPGYHDETVTLVAINERVICEEENVFYRMLSCSDDLDYIQNSADSIVLFFFSKEVLEEENYYSSLYHSFPIGSEKRFKIKVSGKFHKNKNQGKHYHHCYDASVFLVTDVISFDDVTDTETFPMRH